MTLAPAEPALETTTERVLVVSSDGHVMPPMSDFRPYVDPEFREAYDAFLAEFEVHGMTPGDPERVRAQYDEATVEEWDRLVVGPGRLVAAMDPARRLGELEREGVAAEILFPDLTMPFEVYPIVQAAFAGLPRPPQEHLEAGKRAYNRWLVDFCRTAPGRYAGMAVVTFDDVDQAIRELHWAKEAGLPGIILPTFSYHRPLYAPEFDPIWRTLVELDLVANSHAGFSAVDSGLDRVVPKGAPSMTAQMALMFSAFTHLGQELLRHLIWGGVLERHPGLKVAFTEFGSGWVVRDLAQMDYTFGSGGTASFLRDDIRDVVKHKPSEYFARQCYLGSSLLSKAEVEARAVLGVDNMMVGVDYPHHEGTWLISNLDYLQATFGAAGVGEADTRKMLGENAARLFGFDMAVLAPVVERVGPVLSEVLTAPQVDLFPRGDVHKPL